MAHICPKYTYLELKAALHQEFNRLDILLNKNMVFHMTFYLCLEIQLNLLIIKQKAIEATVLRLSYHYSA